MLVGGLRLTALILLCSSTSLIVTAQPGQNIQDLITVVENLVHEKTPDVGELKLKQTELERELPALKTKAGEPNSTDADKGWYARAEAAITKANKKIKAIEAPSIADLIGSTKPMTAVLFSGQDRNSFEVVKDPMSTDTTTGIINQRQMGSTAGILIAAEAPFAFPEINNSRMPIGAWFGVNLKTGNGDDVADVDLAAGLSFSLISAERLKKLTAGSGPGLTGSARLLIGVIYGEVATLGPKNTTSALEVGDPYPLGDALPLNKNKEISWTFGIGFRF